MTMAKGSPQTVRNALAGTEITAVMLAAGDRTEVLFLYRFPMLKAILANKEIREFLKSCGYVQFDLASILMGLKRKYTAYLAGSGEFPHELGVLPEYPVEDVRDFIRYNGDKFRLPVTGKYIIILLRQGEIHPVRPAREAAMQSRS